MITTYGTPIPALKKNYEVDTEVFLSLLQMFRGQGKPLVEAVREVFNLVEGSASVALEFDDLNNLVLASNTGSLYMALSQNGKILVFASEKYILQQWMNNQVTQLFLCRAICFAG